MKKNSENVPAIVKVILTIDSIIIEKKKKTLCKHFSISMLII